MPRTVAPLVIGPHEIWPPLILAPMSGVTNRTMRALYKPFGLGLTVTEFVSANALRYASSNKRTMEMIDQHGLEKPVSTQLWGDDPQVMAQAARVVRECGADIVDINFGCPAPKVVKTNGGSACLRDVDRCEAIMDAVVRAVDCPVTVKMRLGWTEEQIVYTEVARRAQSVGVRAVTLHARTARLTCQEALSQISNSAVVPRAASRSQHQARNWVVMALSGRSSTHRSRVSSRRRPASSQVRTISP